MKPLKLILYIAVALMLGVINSCTNSSHASRYNLYLENVIPLANTELKNLPIDAAAKIDYQHYKEIHLGACNLSNSLLKVSTDKGNIKPWADDECIALMEEARPNIAEIKKRPPMPMKPKAVKCGPPSPDQLHLGDLAKTLTEKQGKGIFPTIANTKKYGDCGIFINYGDITEHQESYDSYEVLVSIDIDENNKQKVEVDISAKANKEVARKVLLAVISVMIPSDATNWSQVLDKEIFSIPKTEDIRVKLSGTFGKYFPGAEAVSFVSNKNLYIHFVDK